MPAFGDSPPSDSLAFSFCSTMVTHRPRRMSLMNSSWLLGSVDMPPQFMPPSEPGKDSDLSVSGTVYRPS
ncbi:hypothetical protein D3C71_2137630 [compost metagenome]